MGIQAGVGKWLLSLALLIGGMAQAKELTNRLGVGFSNQFVQDLPSLAVRYYPSSDLGLSGSLGVDTEKDNSRFGLRAQIYRVIFMEDNLNFYIGGGGGLLSIETKGKNESGFELSGFLGAEFFFYGLDSLAFLLEVGVEILSFSNQVRFRTVGDHPFQAGMVFYF